MGTVKVHDYVKKTRSAVLLSLGHMTTHWYMGVLMVILPYLKGDLSLTFTEVGLLISLRSLAGALGNVTSGIIADFVGRRTLMLILSVAGLGCCWFFIGFAQTYLLLLILFPLATLSSNLWHAPAMSILSEAYPERKGFTLGIHGAAANLGQSISPLVVGLLITYLGWRTAVKINITPAMLTAILLAVLLPGLGILEVKKKTRGEFIQLLKKQLLKNKTLFFISLISAFRTLAQRGIETFLALFLAGQLGLSPVLVGAYIAILTVSSTFPEPLLGWLSDHIGRKSILWISFTVSGLSVIAITLVNPGAPLIVSLVLLGFFHYSLRPIIFAFALDVTPPEIGGSTISYVFAWNQSLSALAPIAGGFLADAFGIEFALYLTGFLSLTAAALVSLLKPRKKQA
jgi:MFS family permease